MSSPAFNNLGTEDDLRGEIPPPIVEDPQQERELNPYIEDGRELLEVKH